MALTRVDRSKQVTEPYAVNNVDDTNESDQQPQFTHELKSARVILDYESAISDVAKQAHLVIDRIGYQ